MLFRRNGRGKDEPAPTQEHVPVTLVQDDIVVSRPLQRGGRVMAAVLRVGSRDVTRMSEGERADFLEQYTARLAQWQFPYQILVWRERQDLAEFMQRAREKRTAWNMGKRREWGEHLGQLTGWMERVISQVNPQVPVYFIALPHPISSLMGHPYDEALTALDGRCRTVTNSLAVLGIGVRRLNDEEILNVIAAFYHPTLPMLHIPPRQRMHSLMVGSKQDEQQEDEDAAWR